MFSPGAVCQTPTRDSGCGYGKGFSRTPSTTLNTAMLAPTPAASVISVITVNTGARQSLRKICLSWLEKEVIVDPPGGVEIGAGDVNPLDATQCLSNRFLDEVGYSSICDEWQLFADWVCLACPWPGQREPLLRTYPTSLIDSTI